MIAARTVRLSLLKRTMIAIGAIVLSAGMSATAAHAEIDLALPGGGGSYNYTVKSLLEMRFTNVVKQEFDYSCGSAALATMLKYFYERDISERDILEDMYVRGDKEKIHKEGFSLLDMKQYLARHGYKSSGYRTSLDKLRSVGVPAIVLINKKGYEHFVVVKGVTKNKVLVGDPAQGLFVYDRSEFEPMWNNILFVIDNHKQTARQHFNTVQTWGGKDKPYFAKALSNADLARLTLSTTPTPNYY